MQIEFKILNSKTNFQCKYLQLIMITLKNSSFCNYQKIVHTSYNTLIYCKNTVKIMWKDTASAKFWVNLPKLRKMCGSRKFLHQEIR